MTGPRIRVVPPTVPTTGAPFHPSATHADALGMPVAGVGEFTFHPTPCCGAAASVDEDGAMYCKACYHEVDPAYGNVPVEPLREVERQAEPEPEPGPDYGDGARRYQRGDGETPIDADRPPGTSGSWGEA